MDKLEEVGCDFKGSCGNRLANGCCSNVPSLSCSWQKPKPDEDNDPQAEMVGRFIELGWLTPEEARMKEAECQARIEALKAEVLKEVGEFIHNHNSSSGWRNYRIVSVKSIERLRAGKIPKEDDYNLPA